MPYGGFKGDYQSIVVLTPTANGFPWLAKLGPTSYGKVVGPVTYTLNNGDYPYILAHLDHQSQQLKMEVFNATRGKAWHAFVKDEYLPRNATSTGFFAFSFDGRTQAGNKIYTVPDGTYVIKVSVLKALGVA